MDIHNNIEDMVFKYLDEILESKEGVCKCEQCKTDMACYALNRIKPMYVVSSRGIIHTENKRREDRQEEIDVFTTVSEAIDIVSNTRRHEVNSAYKYDINQDKLKSADNLNQGCFFNFPQFIGRIFDSSNLSPIFDAEVILYDKMTENKINMFNNTWENPVKLVPQMEGTYSFWPAPVSAKKSGIQKDFYMNISVIKKDYEPVIKFFYIRLVSAKTVITHITKENIICIDDIFISQGNRQGGRLNSI
jgi:competence protein ComFB